MTLELRLRPFLTLDLGSWQGLPHASPAEFDAVLGAPVERSQSELGFYPAERYVYRELVAYARRNRVILIESIRLPELPVLEKLPEPCGLMGHEILVPGSYAHEYVYCGIGLVLTIARPFQAGAPDKVARCRGIKPIAKAADFGPEYYKAFEDQMSLSERSHAPRRVS